MNVQEFIDVLEDALGGGNKENYRVRLASDTADWQILSCYKDEGPRGHILWIDIDQEKVTP